MTPKFLYVEDDTAILVGANGTALAALLLNATDIVSVLKLPMPALPMWTYLVGLLLAFSAKAIIQIMNDDIRQREKLQQARDFYIEAQENPHLTPELAEQLQVGWRLVEQQHARLLKPHHGPRLDLWRAIFYFSSALCFVVATSLLVYQASKLVPIAEG